ncbi:MAG: universal stress protein, partial [Nitrosarchaeum sp.]
ILVAVDGSMSAKKAFEKSLFLSQKCNSKLDIVHVIPCEFGGDSATVFELLSELKIKGEKVLEECKKEAAKNNISVELMIESGDPAQIIIEITKNKNYDLIIIGTRGKSVFQELLLGSVALKVMHHARCPVMVVR